MLGRPRRIQGRPLGTLTGDPGHKLLLFRQRAWMKALAVIGLVFLSSGYGAPIAIAAVHASEPPVLPALEIPGFAFPSFDKDGAKPPAEKHDAADALLPRDDAAPPAAPAEKPAAPDRTAPTGGAPTEVAVPQSGAAPSGPAPAPDGAVPDVVDSNFDLDSSTGTTGEKKDPNATAPVFESYIGAPLLTTSTDPIVQGHSQSPLDELATNPLGLPSTVLAPPAPTISADPPPAEPKADAASDKVVKASSASSDPALDRPEAQLQPVKAAVAQKQPVVTASQGAAVEPQLSEAEVTAVIDEVLSEPVAPEAEDEGLQVAAVESEPVVPLAAPVEPEVAAVVPEPAPVAPAPEIGPAVIPTEGPSAQAQAGTLTVEEPATISSGSAAPTIASVPVAPVISAPAPVTYVTVYAPPPPPPPPPVTPELLTATASVLAGGAALIDSTPVAVAPGADQTVALLDDRAALAADVLSVDVTDADVAMAEPADEPGDLAPVAGAPLVGLAAGAVSSERNDRGATPDVAAGGDGAPSSAPIEFAELAQAFTESDAEAAAARGPPAGDGHDNAVPTGTPSTSVRRTISAADTGSGTTGTDEGLISSESASGISTHEDDGIAADPHAAITATAPAVPDAVEPPGSASLDDPAINASTPSSGAAVPGVSGGSDATSAPAGPATDPAADGAGITGAAAGDIGPSLADVAPAAPAPGISSGSASGASGAAGAVGAPEGSLAIVSAPLADDTAAAAAAAQIVSDPQTQAWSARGPPAGSVLIIASQGGTVSSGDATLTFAPGSLPADAYVRIVATDTTGTGLAATSGGFDLQAFDAATGDEIHLFRIPPVLTIAVGRNLPVAPSIYYVDPETGAEQIVSTYDAASGDVTALLPHFSIFTSAVVSRVWEITLTDETLQSIVVSVVGTDVVVTVADPGGSESEARAIADIDRLVITGGSGSDVLLLASMVAGVTVEFDGAGGLLDAVITAPGTSVTATGVEQQVDLGDYVDFGGQLSIVLDLDVDVEVGGTPVSDLTLVSLGITGGSACLCIGGAGFDTTFTSLDLAFLIERTGAKRVWYAGKGVVDASLVGVDGLTLDLTGVTVELNHGPDGVGADWTTLDLNPDNATPDPLAAFTATGELFKASGTITTLNAFDFASATDGSIAYESSLADVVGLAGGDVLGARLTRLAITVGTLTLGAGGIGIAVTGGELYVATITSGTRTWQTIESSLGTG